MKENLERFSAVKTFIGFTNEDIERVQEAKPILVARQEFITDSFYETILATPETAKFVDGRLEKLKATHEAWFNSLFEGNYQEEYFNARWKIGLAHVRVGLPPEWVESVMSIINGLILTELSIEILDGKRLARTHWSVSKVLDLDRSIINLAYQDDRLNRISEFTGMGRKLIENVITIAR